MNKAIIGKKLGMTQIFSADGKVIPVTVVEAGPCPVVQIKTKGKDGYEAVKVGFGKAEEKNLNKPDNGQFKKAGVEPQKVLKEFRVDDLAKYSVGQVLTVETFAEGDKDFKAQMTNIAAADPDVVFAPIYYAEAGLAITAARAAGCDAVFMGGDGFGSVKNYASAEDLEGSVYCSGYAPGTDSVKQFEEDYKAAYNVDEIPNMFAPLAYDAAMLICEGLKAAEEQGLTAGTEEYKQAVIDAIKNMNGTEGITGSYSFDEYNNPIKPVAIIELTGGDEVYQEMY